MKIVMLFTAVLLLPGGFYMPFLADALLQSGALPQSMGGMVAILGLPVSLTGAALLLIWIFY